MLKILTNDYDFGEPGIRIADRRRPMVKSASNEMRDFLKTVEAEDGKTKLLVLAMGSGEAYGSNRNGDWFSEEDLTNRHHTFEKYAYLYKHHCNKDPKKSYGTVKKSFYNPLMKRVELLVEVDNSKAPDIVKRANAGEDIPVSMSCKVPYDICSICGHKSKQISDYCGHLKESMTKVLPDGRQVYAINPNPTFFDISAVYKPADRIAYVLEKVASAITPSAQLALDLGLSEYDFEPILFDKAADTLLKKKAIIRKLAEIEKEIEGILQKPEPETPREKFIKDDAPKALVVVMKTPSAGEAGSLKHLLSGLAEHGIMLSPQEFSDELSGGCGPDITSLLPGIFSRLSGASSIDQLLGKDMFGMKQGLIPDLPKSFLSRLAANRSLLHRPAARRIIKITVVKPSEPVVKLIPGGASVSDSSEVSTVEKSAAAERAEDLAVAYALYKVSALATAADSKDETLPLLTVLQNYLET